MGVPFTGHANAPRCKRRSCARSATSAGDCGSRDGSRPCRRAAGTPRGAGCGRPAWPGVSSRVTGLHRRSVSRMDLGGPAAAGAAQRVVGWLGCRIRVVRLDLSRGFPLCMDSHRATVHRQYAFVRLSGDRAVRREGSHADVVDGGSPAPAHLVHTVPLHFRHSVADAKIVRSRRRPGLPHHGAAPGWCTRGAHE